MKKSDLANPPALPDALPVLCAKCRESGRMGEGDFAYLGELLAFTPVPRRPHVNGWDPERQRGFIAALAVTGSPSRAARAIGKHSFGAEQLRNARGGQSFAAAWDAAMEISRERELVHFSTGLANLARAEEKRLAAMDITDRPTGPIVDSQEEEEVREAMCRIRQRLTKARRLFLLHIAGDAKKRRAWDLLVGRKADWVRAAAGDPQPGDMDEQEIMLMRFIEQGMPNLAQPDMVVTVAAGFLAEVAGGEDATKPYRDLIEAFGKPAADLTEEEQAVVANYAGLYRKKGWKQHDDGSWYLPLPAPEMRPSIMPSHQAQESDRPRSRPSAGKRPHGQHAGGMLERPLRGPASGSAKPSPTDELKRAATMRPHGESDRKRGKK